MTKKMIEIIRTSGEGLMGLPLEDVLRQLRDAGIEPEIIRISGWREAQEGTERVIRVSEDGMRITSARFPDKVVR